MIKDEYILRFDDDYKKFVFISEGPKGSIVKGIQYSETAITGVYNLGFGDINELNEIDDLVVTNNGDSQKVLATVARTLFYFTTIIQMLLYMQLGAPLQEPDFIA